jgi:hypothetical protein
MNKHYINELQIYRDIKDAEKELMELNELCKINPCRQNKLNFTLQYWIVSNLKRKKESMKKETKH